jgi:hypothetical protein
MFNADNFIATLRSTIHNVRRFGSKADVCSATGHVRFASNSDRESRHAENGHVRFPPKADMCGN